MKNIILITLISVFVVSCASDPNYVNLNKKTLGYTDYPIAEGLTKVKIEIHQQPWGFYDFVRKNFLRRAHFLCPNGFTVFDEDEGHLLAFTGPFGKYHSTFKAGYILCYDSPIKMDEVGNLKNDKVLETSKFTKADIIEGDLDSCFIGDSDHTFFLLFEAAKHLSPLADDARSDDASLSCYVEALLAPSSKDDRELIINKIISIQENRSSHYSTSVNIEALLGSLH